MSEEKIFGNAEQDSSKVFVDQYMLAVIARRKKDYEAGIKIMTVALENNRSRSLEFSGRFFLGELCLLADDPKNGLEQFNHCLGIRENDSSALCWRGICLVAMKEIESAKKSFHMSVENNQHDNIYSRVSRPYYELCILYRKDENLEKAFDMIDEALKIDETNVFYQCEKLLLGAQMNNSFDEALLEIDKIIEVNLKKEDVFAYPYYIKGICLQVKEAFQEAYECITKAFEVKVDYRRVNEYQLHVNRGYYCYQIGKFEESIGDFKKAQELVETKKKGEITGFEINKMGLCYTELGELEKALECFEKAIELKEVSEFYENMGNCRMILSEHNEDEYEKAAFLYYKAWNCENGIETFQAYENLGIISEYFMGSMKGENVLMHMCRTIKPPASLDLVLFISKEMDCDPEGRNEYDRNLLMYLIMNPNGISLEVIEKLIEETEINVHEVDQLERWNLAHHAAMNPLVNVDVLSFISKHLEEYELKEIDNMDRSILHLHCSNGKTKLEVLKHLLEDLSISTEDVCVDGKNPLHYLCETDPENVECILYLIKKGVSSDQEDQNGKKPLDHLAEEIREKIMSEK